AGALVEGGIAVGGALQHRDHARSDTLAVHQRIVELDDFDLGLGVGAGGNILGDLTDVAVHGGADAGVIGPDRAGHVHRLGHDVAARAAVDGGDADHGRRLHQIGAPAHDGLQPHHDLRRRGDRVDGTPRIAAVALPAGDLDAQFVGAGHGGTGAV